MYQKHAIDTMYNYLLRLVIEVSVRGKKIIGSVGKAFAYGMIVSCLSFTNDFYRYVEEISLVAILATKRMAGVKPEVYHIFLCQVQIRLPNLALKPRGDVTRSLKQGYQWPYKKDFCPPKLKREIH